MRLTFFVLVLAAWPDVVSPVLAQSPPPARPSNATFGPRAARSSTNQQLDVSATLGQAYDDNLLAESGQISPGTARVSGHYTMLQGSGEYKARIGAFEFALTGASAFRSYGLDGRISTLNHSAGAGVAARLARRTNFTVNQGLTYSSSSLFGLFARLSQPEPGDAPRLAPDYYVSDVPFRAYVTTAAITHGLSPRISIAAAADYTFTDFTQESRGRRDMSSYSAHLGLARALGRRSALAARYRYRTGEFHGETGPSASEHGVEIGVEHTRVLSATRQAHFGLSVGVATMDVPVAATGASRGTFYRTIAEASFDYPFGRSWQAGAVYRRGLQYVPDLTEPIIAGGWSATVGGLLTRRVDLLVSAACSRGESALYAASAFDTCSSSIRGRVALSQTLAAYGEYLYYVYDFATATLLARGLPEGLERHGLRAGLTFWIPVFGR